MIFKSITLQNFRQYKGKHKFEFSIPESDEKNITLLIAANGVGKTTFLQAFRFCFYGSTSAYLNLPKIQDLITNTIYDDLKELESSELYVEVEFIHNNTRFVAKRVKKFERRNGKMKDYGEEEFTLTQQTEFKGEKYLFKPNEAKDKINNILPAGLSQVFMFDGERMESDISSREFSRDLKESILAILDIKKYEKLVERIGSPGKKTSVIGILTSRKNSSDEKQYFHVLEKVHNNTNALENERKFLENWQHEKKKIENELDMNKELQEKQVDIGKKSERKNSLEREIDTLRDRSKELSSLLINKSKQLIIYKLLNANKVKYDLLLSKKTRQDDLYMQLHIDTINDILKKERCICGRPVNHKSEVENHLIHMKSLALPTESAQYLNLVSQQFYKAEEYDELFLELKGIKKKIIEIKKDIHDKYQNVAILKSEIDDFEKKHDSNFQSRINELTSRRDDLINKIGGLERNITLREKTLKVLQRDVDELTKKNEENLKIDKYIDKANDIKNHIEKIKNERELIAKSILSKKFDEVLNDTIHGNYKVTLDQNYQITIQDLLTNKDATSTLSTGQNIILSLAFIKALIDSSRDLSTTIKDAEKYGVIMDAALSNLDEKHIERVCRNILNGMDQLIFLSFKRQIRDEMFYGIRKHIGKVYILSKTSETAFESRELPLEELEQYIHEVEEGEILYD